MLLIIEPVTALSLHISPDEVYWGNLSGAMEAIDAGTTTILDHAHLNWTPQHSKHAVAGTISSGVRSIFAYTPTMLLESTMPSPVFVQNPMPDWVMDTMKTLSRTAPLNDAASRVKLGFGFDFWYLPKQMTIDIINAARSYGAEIVTSHAVKFGDRNADSVIKKVHDYDLLDERFVFSHGGGSTMEDVKMLTAANAFVSTTPNTEQAMAVGPSICFRDDLPGSDAICSLGIDCHSATSGSIVNEMRTALQSARGIDSTLKIKQGITLPEKVHHTTNEAYNLGTIQGARALNMENDIGSISVGKKADLVIFDALSPAMVAAAQVDPVTAIVLHSNVGDIESVLVDGEFRKKNYKLLDAKAVSYQDSGAIQETGDTISWSEVAKKVVESQTRLLPLMPGLGLDGLDKSFRQMLSH